MTARPISAARPLVDSRFVRLQLVESGEGGRVIVRGEFARANAPTENKRLYPPKIWQLNSQRLESAMQNRRLYGEVDHPDDGKTKLMRTSHIVTNLKLQDDGIVIGEAVILDTDAGRNLKAILAGGGMVGVSSRGFGSTSSDERGYEVVQEDYNLVAFDFVADPADSSAYPNVVYEGRVIPTENVMTETPKQTSSTIDVSALIEQARKDERAKVTAELQKTMSEELYGKLKELQKDIEEDVKTQTPNQLLESVKNLLLPTLIDADVQKVIQEAKNETNRHKAALLEATSKLREKDLLIEGLETRVGTLEQNLEEMGRVAVVSGLRFYLEQKLMNDPDASTIRELVGEVSQYEDVGALKECLGKVRTGLSEQRKLREAMEAKYTRELQELRQAQEEERKRNARQHQELVVKNQKLENLLEDSMVSHKKTLETEKDLRVQLHAQRQIQYNPNRTKINSVLETARPKTVEQADQLIEQVGQEPAPKDALQEEKARSNVRNWSRASVPTPQEEETPRARPRLMEGVAEQTGVRQSIDEYRSLAGISGKK